MRPLFAYPFHGRYSVSSPYGQRGGGFHTGTDFNVPHGTPILAANDGQVIYCAYEAGGAGNTVTISGDDGWQSRYHHLREWCVYHGQWITRGALVGYCDSTGASSGPHLHFEIRPTPQTTTDPVPILEADAGATAPPPEGFTMGQMEDLAQWEHDTRAIILDALVGNAWRGYPAPTNILGAWLWDQSDRIIREITAELDALPTDDEGRTTVPVAQIRDRVLAAFTQARAGSFGGE